MFSFHLAIPVLLILYLLFIYHSLHELASVLVDMVNNSKCAQSTSVFREGSFRARKPRSASCCIQEGSTQKAQWKPEADTPLTTLSSLVFQNQTNLICPSQLLLQAMESWVIVRWKLGYLLLKCSVLSGWDSCDWRIAQGHWACSSEKPRKGLSGCFLKVWCHFQIPYTSWIRK